MLEIKNVEVIGLKRMGRVSGYPMQTGIPDTQSVFKEEEQVEETSVEYKRMRSLGNAPTGSGHDVSLSGIVVQFDVKFSQYWLKQFQRYHFVQINSSQSTMHAIRSIDLSKSCNQYTSPSIIKEVSYYIEKYNELFSESVDSINVNFPYGSPKYKDMNTYELLMIIISNLPSGYESWMGVTTNYQQLKTIYYQRRHHKLKEDWGYFCKWCESLPYFTEFCGNVKS